MPPAIALSIAGSDSCAGAGVQADLKTFTALGVYGVCAVTSITAQNTCGVLGAWRLEPAAVEVQLEALFADFAIEAAKTGMLYDKATVEVVADFLAGRAVSLVVDPVLFAWDGRPLLQAEGVEALKRQLFPLARLVTPNLREVSCLVGVEPEGRAELEDAACKLLDFGPQAVLIKGGHAGGDSPEVGDLFFDGEDFVFLPHPRLPERHWHGTGCTLSAAITAGLAQHLGLLPAIQRAVDYTLSTMLQAWELGQGCALLNHKVEG